MTATTWYVIRDGVRTWRTFSPAEAERESREGARVKAVTTAE